MSDYEDDAAAKPFDDEASFDSPEVEVPADTALFQAPVAADEPAPAEEAEKAEEAAAADEPDPFASWPQPRGSQGSTENAAAETAAVETSAPAAAPSTLEHVAHAGGELDIPEIYNVVEGAPIGQRRAVAVVVARFNAGLTNRMLKSALDALADAGVAPDAITVMPVPGAFELPLAAMALAKTRRYACVVALGAVVRGETPHFDFVAGEAASGLQLAAIETGIPVSFGVLTVETVEQGEARIDRAAEAVKSALEMADVFAQLRATA